MDTCWFRKQLLLSHRHSVKVTRRETDMQSLSLSLSLPIGDRKASKPACPAHLARTCQSAPSNAERGRDAGRHSGKTSRLWNTVTKSDLYMSYLLMSKDSSVSVTEWMLRGTWGAQSVKCLPFAQVMILGSWDGAPHRAPCSEGNLLLPLLAHAFCGSFCLSL